MERELSLACTAPYMLIKIIALKLHRDRDYSKIVKRRVREMCILNKARAVSSFFKQIALGVFSGNGKYSLN